MIKEFRTLHHDLGKIVGADVDGVGAARALKSAPRVERVDTCSKRYSHACPS